MHDSRFNSVHLGILPRRQEYRSARAALLQERGWVTLAGERVQGMIAPDADWVPLLPERLPFLPTAKYVLVDRETGEPHALRTGLNAIGRMPNNDIVFTEAPISRRHCAILVHSTGSCELHDTASRNGTYVNGRRVEHPVGLRVGDLIQLCKKQLFFASLSDYSDAVDGDVGEITPPA